MNANAVTFGQGCVMQCLLNSCTTKIKQRNLFSPPYGMPLSPSGKAGSKKKSPKKKTPKKSPEKEHNGSAEKDALYKMDPRMTRSRHKTEYQKEVMAGSIKDLIKESDFINPDQFVKYDNDTKLLTMIASLNRLHHKFDTVCTDVYKEESGLAAKINSAKDDIIDVKEDQEGMKFEMQIMKGVIGRLEQQVKSLNQRLQDLTSRQMGDNIIISGITDLPERSKRPPVKDAEQVEDEAEADDPPTFEEKCEEVAKEFCKNLLGIEIKEHEILNAHTMGADGKLLVIKCVPKLRVRIMQKKSKLSKKNNSKGKPYFVNVQVPEAVVAAQKELSQEIKKIKVQNNGKPEGAKIKYQVKGGELFVDGKKKVKQTAPPEFLDLFVDEAEQDKIDKIKITYSEPKRDKGSVFVAAIAKVSGPTELRRAYKQVKQTHPAATHISVGFDYQNIQCNCDDGEYGLGLRLQNILAENNCSNKALFMVRNYGGKKLGQKRFEIAKEAALEVIVKMK